MRSCERGLQVTAPCRILVLDDEPEILEALRRGIFQSLPDYEARFVTDVYALMRTLETGFLPDILLTDGNVPSVCVFRFLLEEATGVGTEVAELVLRQHPGLRAVIVFTGLPKALELPVFTFQNRHAQVPTLLIAKPDMSALKKALERLLVS